MLLFDQVPGSQTNQKIPFNCFITCTSSVNKVSLITVCFNSSATIRDTLESVVSQSYPYIEHIIIDGGSSDGTREIIEEYNPSITISEPDKGIYDAMNKGVKLASGDIIGILNSDDILAHDNVISIVVQHFKNHSAENNLLDCVVGSLFFKDFETGRIMRFCDSSYWKPSYLKYGLMPPHTACFVRKEVYKKCGLYSLEYKIAADYDLFIRWFLKSEISYTRTSEIFVHMRKGGVSTSGFKNKYILNKEVYKCLESNSINTNPFNFILKIPFKLYELIRVFYMKSSNNKL